MTAVVKQELNAIEKTSLGTRWNWTVVVNASDPRKCFGIFADQRHYRVIEEIDRITKKSHFRIDVLGSLGMIWEALDSKKYRTPTGAARAVVKLHAAYLKQRRDRAVARINFT
jgi:hypothetical protein